MILKRRLFVSISLGLLSSSDNFHNPINLDFGISIASSFLAKRGDVAVKKISFLTKGFSSLTRAFLLTQIFKVWVFYSTQSYPWFSFMGTKTNFIKTTRIEKLHKVHNFSRSFKASQFVNEKPIIFSFVPNVVSYFNFNPDSISHPIPTSLWLSIKLYLYTL